MYDISKLDWRTKLHIGPILTVEKESIENTNLVN